jgi:Trypsin-co-occurring domain 2
MSEPVVPAPAPSPVAYGPEGQSPLRLRDAVEALRAELEGAIASSTGKELRFALGTVEFEVEIEITSSQEASGEVGFWVVKAGATGSRSDSTVHRLSVTLQPRLGGDGEVLIADELARRPD